MQSEVQEYQLTKVKIADLKFDDSNPNKMTKEQEQALTKAIQRFGYLVPIVINEDHKIGDGEHRAKLYKDLGYEEIPAFIVPKINNDVERRMLRQTMNKLNGQHDLKLDSDELAIIFDDNKLSELSELLAQPVESLSTIMNLFQDKESIEPTETEIEMDNSNLRLSFQMPDKQTYIEVVERLRQMDLNDQNQALINLVRNIE
ncbi:MAG TPA: ParB N-terminal domain-containing protein [Nitrososphaeraceae archaeon]